MIFINNTIVISNIIILIKEQYANRCNIPETMD
jgi:hypothetical protein